MHVLHGWLHACMPIASTVVWQLNRCSQHFPSNMVSAAGCDRVTQLGRLQVASHVISAQLLPAHPPLLPAPASWPPGLQPVAGPWRPSAQHGWCCLQQDGGTAQSGVAPLALPLCEAVGAMLVHVLCLYEALGGSERAPTR